MITGFSKARDAVVRVVDAARTAPRTPRSSPTTRCPRDGGTASSASWDTPGRPDWVKGRFDNRITHGSGTPPTGSAEKDISDKPNYLRRLPELTRTRGPRRPR